MQIFQKISFSKKHRNCRNIKKSFEVQSLFQNDSLRMHLE